MKRTLVLAAVLMLGSLVLVAAAPGQPLGQERFPKQGDSPTRDRTRYPARPVLVEPPSPRYRTYNEATFTINVPENWREVEVAEQIAGYAPNNGFRKASNGQTVITHGVTMGVVQSKYTDLQLATNERISRLQQGNPNLRPSGNSQRTTVDGRAALAIRLNNVNEATGEQELVTVVTTILGNGQLFYLIFVSPSNEYLRYRRAFNDIQRTLALNSRGKMAQ